jgi:hypothetical protein
MFSFSDSNQIDFILIWGLFGHWENHNTSHMRDKMLCCLKV